MPNLPISGLPAAAALAAADLTVIVQGGVTVQSTVGAFATFTGLALSRWRHIPYVVGQIYPVFPFSVLVAGTAMIANTVTCCAFMVPASMPVDALIFRVNTLFAGSNVQLALYVADGLGRATGLPVATTASVSSASTGVKTAVLSATVTLDPDTVYCLCTNCDSGAVQLLAPAQTQPIARLWSGTTAATTFASGSAFECNYDTAQVFGTWPDLTAAVWASTSNTRMAHAYLRAA